jgi:hypothetical protein
MFVLVFSMAAMAQTYAIGSIQGEDTISFSTDVTVGIDKYARVWLVENKLFQSDGKANLLGRPGLYTSDEWQVIKLAKEYFADKNLEEPFWKEEAWEIDENRQGGTLFRVESNCDANVNVEFAWNGTPLNSELVLWVFRHRPNDYPPVNNGVGDQSLISTKTGPFDIDFAHNYEGQHEKGREYKIGGGLFIDFISQQEAADYTGVITITVSAAADEPAL